MNHLWPLSAHLDETGELWIGGCAVRSITQQFGTPLYLFDELTLRSNAAAYRCGLAAYAGGANAAYASKALLCTAIAQLIHQEGLELDVVSGGELYVALHAGFPAPRIHFHGNNKTPDELAAALAAGVGRIVVDNFHELATLDGLTRERAEPVSVWLRLAPGVQAHTHAHIQTGQEDTKFGFSIAAGDAERAVSQTQACRGLRLVGLHAHIGSQIYEPESLAASAGRLLQFAARMRARCGFALLELSPGGGWGVPMVAADAPAALESYFAALTAAVENGCREHGLPLPRLVLEPGRSLVARAGIAIYTVGSRKEIPGVRTYVALDGGMADNIRPALYEAQYTALRIPDAQAGEGRERVTLAGKYCESGDVLIRDIALPPLRAGDLVAVPMAGAYTLAMASNYNQSLRPAVVLARDGEAQLIQRREQFGDLTARDLPLRAATGLPDASPPTPRARGRRLCKYDALGNDYIVLDPQEWPALPTPAEIRLMCDRHHGIGGDGVLWGPLSAEPFGLRLFNPDGSEFEKSGNGLRIFARFLWDRGLPAKPHFAIRTPVGDVVAHVLDGRGERIAMELGRASFRTDDAGVTGSSRELLETPVTVSEQSVPITVVSIGNPHCVVFPPAQETADDDLDALAQRLGPALERLPLYQSRTNVQFARVVDRHTLRIAIWERGAGYTLASGTSSCAAAAAAIRTGRCESPVTVRMAGGEMLVEVAADWSVRLTGTVRPVMQGEWSGT